jgi:hypothetical protein
MTVTGHKTVAVFHRYHIVAPSDLQEATRKLEVSQEREREFLNAQTAEFGQTSGIVAPKPRQTDDLVESEASPTPLPN